MSSTTSDDTLRPEFDRFDHDKSGAIDEDEFHALIRSLGVTFSAEQTATAFLAIDTNGNRRIDYAEFRKWWTRRTQG